VAIRTFVVTVSPLLSELVIEMLRPHLGLDIVAVVSTRDGLTEKLRAAAPQLVVLGLMRAETNHCVKVVLRAMPSLQVLVLAQDGQRAWLYEMRPRRMAVTDLSAPALIRLLGTRFDCNLPA
jgi:DNA-binding NarL/FixJ family response regulator